MLEGRLTFPWISSNFFASRSSCGTPWGLAWALRKSFQSSLQNDGVSLSRNPVSCIWRALISGFMGNHVSKLQAPTDKEEVGRGAHWEMLGLGKPHAARTYMTRALDQIEDQLNNHVVLASKYFGDFSCDPSA